MKGKLNYERIRKYRLKTINRNRSRTEIHKG